MDTEHFECQCYSDEHTLKFNIDDEDGYIYASVFLNQWNSWYKRIWIALKYVFGYKCKYGHFDSFMLRLEDHDRFRLILKKSEEYSVNAVED